MISSNSSLFVALALAVGVCVPLARAQTDRPEISGTLTGFSCASLPAAPRVAVEAQEDSAAFRRLKQVFISGLRQRKAVVVDAAPLRASLYVDSMRENNAPLTGRVPHPVRNLNPPSRSAFIELWSNKRTSVFGGRRSRSLSVDQIQVSILIHDSASGRCVWQGEAVHAIGDHDELDIAEQLVAALSRQIGVTVRAKPVRLR